MRPCFVLLAWVLAFSEAAEIDIHTPSKKITMLTEYGYVYEPGGVNWFTFKVKVCSDARVGLYNDGNVGWTFNYQVIIGGWNNTRSFIRSKGRVNEVYNKEASLVTCNDYRSFWISWHDGDIFVGRGLVTHQDVIMSMIKPTDSPVAFRNVGVWTWYLDAYWQIAPQVVGSFWNLLGDQQWTVLPESVNVNMTSTPIWTDDAPHDIACARACHSRPPCVSFVYYGSERKCHGYSENFHTQP